MIGITTQNHTAIALRNGIKSGKKESEGGRKAKKRSPALNLQLSSPPPPLVWPSSLAPFSPV